MPPVAAYMPTPQVPRVPEVPEVPRFRVPRFRGSKGSRLAIEPGTVRTLEPEPLELREPRNLWNLTWRRTPINATRSGVHADTSGSTGSRGSRGSTVSGSEVPWFQGFEARNRTRNGSNPGTRTPGTQGTPEPLEPHLAQNANKCHP